MLFINKLFNSIACLLYFINLQLVIPGRTWILLYLGRTVYKRLWACLALYLGKVMFSQACIYPQGVRGLGYPGHWRVHMVGHLPSQDMGPGYPIETRKDGKREVLFLLQCCLVKSQWVEPSALMLNKLRMVLVSILFSDSDNINQFSFRCPPKFSNHIYWHWNHTEFMKRICWRLAGDWLKRNDMNYLFRLVCKWFHVLKFRVDEF